MALIRADRVKETSTSTGTGAFTLAGADSTYRTFASVCAVADTVYYAIAHRTSNEWEVGLGTYSATNTLTRTMVHASSNANAAVTFTAGTKDVLLALTKNQLETYATLGGTETLTNKTINASSNTITNVSLTTGVTGTLPIANGGTGGTTAVSGAVNLIKSAPNDGAEYTLKSKQISGAPSFYWVDSTGYAPTLDLLFAADKSLTPYTGPTPSYSRASTGTFFNSSGVLTTAAVNGPRFNHVFNGTSWVSKGLLFEEQRTNAVLYSADFTSGWTSSNVGMSTAAGTAPNGTSTAVKLYPTASTTQTRIYRSGGANTCISVFAKAAEKTIVFFYDLTGVNVCYFNLSTGAIGTNSTGLTAAISNCGGGWFRCSLSSASAFSFIQIGVCDANGSTSSTASGTNGILIWGAQAEIGSFPTSYIPTTTAAVTRSADVCQISGADFSSFWNASEGSFALEADSIGFASTGSNRFFYAAQSGGVTFYSLDIDPTLGLEYRVVNSSMQAQLTHTQPNAGVLFKHSLCYKVNDFASSLNGSAVATDTSGTLPTATSLGVGYFPGFNQHGNCHIARLRYYPVRLPNATLQVLST